MIIRFELDLKAKTMSQSPLILASLSPFRKIILQNAGLIFDVQGATIDERVVEKGFGSVTPKDLAIKLSEEKAQNVSVRFPDAVVIGCDQTLELQEQVLHKAANLDEARLRLATLSGKDHYLHSAIALAMNGKTIWADVSTAKMSMRLLSSSFIDLYLDRVGQKILGSVGAYQIEGLGIQLFDKIEGDYFTIIGVPILLLLKKLRELGMISQ